MSCGKVWSILVASRSLILERTSTIVGVGIACRQANRVGAI